MISLSLWRHYIANSSYIKLDSRAPIRAGNKRLLRIAANAFCCITTCTIFFKQSHTENMDIDSPHLTVVAESVRAAGNRPRIKMNSPNLTSRANPTRMSNHLHTLSCLDSTWTYKYRSQSVCIQENKRLVRTLQVSRSNRRRRNSRHPRSTRVHRP